VINYFLQNNKGSNMFFIDNKSECNNSLTKNNSLSTIVNLNKGKDFVFLIFFSLREQIKRFYNLNLGIYNFTINFLDNIIKFIDNDINLEIYFYDGMTFLDIFNISIIVNNNFLDNTDDTLILNNINIKISFYNRIYFFTLNGSLVLVI